MPAKYLVTVPPGAPTPVGFVNIGEIFTAPPDYVPSLTFRPVNEEALEAMGKVFDERTAELKRRLKEVEGAQDRRTLTGHIAELEALRKKNLRLFVPEQRQPAIERGVSLKELSVADDATQKEIGSKTDPADQKGAQAKAEGPKGDRKL
jgi:hypothetical protein